MSRDKFKNFFDNFKKKRSGFVSGAENSSAKDEAQKTPPAAAPVEKPASSKVKVTGRRNKKNQPVREAPDFLKRFAQADTDTAKKMVIRDAWEKLCKLQKRLPNNSPQLIDLHSIYDGMGKVLSGKAKLTPEGIVVSKLTTKPTFKPNDLEDGMHTNNCGAPKGLDQLHLFVRDTQFSYASKARECEVVVGLDFGTSCTKVVVQTPYEQGLAFAVPFKPFNHPSGEFFMPTHISKARDGVYSLPISGKNGQFSNLKLDMLYEAAVQKSVQEGPPTQKQRAVVAYLAMVMQFVRGWFLREQAPVYQDLKLMWSINIGVPSKTFDCPELKALYKKARDVSWVVSIDSEPITDGLIDRYWNGVDSGKGSDENLVNDECIVPEVAAEVTGYAQSDLSREGLHLMIDVGSGTLDICGFRLFRENGELHFPIFSADVQSLGASALDRVRAQCVQSELSRATKRSEDVWDLVAPIPAEIDAYLPNIEFLNDKLERGDEAFVEKCLNSTKSIIMDLKRRMDPYAEAWSSEMPVFVCGGGSSHPIYEKVIQELVDWVPKYASKGGVREIRPPVPNALKNSDISNDLYHRLAVAWGLSHPYEDIGKSIPPGEIDPVIAEKVDVPWWRGEGPVYDD
jgi:hypothetical protein